MSKTMQALFLSSVLLATIGISNAAMAEGEFSPPYALPLPIYSVPVGVEIGGGGGFGGGTPNVPDVAQFANNIGKSPSDFALPDNAGAENLSSLAPAAGGQPEDYANALLNQKGLGGTN